MIVQLRFRRPIACGLAALTLLACGGPDDAETTSAGAAGGGHGGDDGGGGSAVVASTSGEASTTVAVSSSSGQSGGAGPTSSATSSGSTSVTSSSAGGGEPCVSALAQGADAPTPGRCEDGAAVVCDVESSTFVTTSCDAGETCAVFEVIEHVFNVDVFIERRTYDWAACIPDDAVACDMAFDGFNWGAESLLAACEGSDKTWCNAPSLPNYRDQGNLRVGTTLGYVHAVPCEAGEACREPLTGATALPGSLACFPSDAPACDSAYSACEGSSHVSCDLWFGYERVENCGADTCMMGCDGIGHCVPEGTRVCDPDIPATCETEDIVETCTAAWCLTSAIDCDEYLFDTQTGMFIPGSCVIVDSGATCLEEGVSACDSSAAETCSNDVAQRCWGGVPNAVDCGAAGLTCRVGFNGEAGCAAADAQACDPDDVAEECDGSVLEGCCPEWGALYSFTYLPCAPGFEASVDCGELPSPLDCTTVDGYAWCRP